ncbi:MAG: CRTAC1 family protein [Pseudooceanicola sp.]|nr:CRTAC1 family protein [Pseudooceanicola sp.]
MRPELLLLLLPAAAWAEPRFDPVPVPEHIYAGGWEHFVGGGIAAFDCSGDGLPELYAAGGSNPATLLRNHGAMSFTADTPPDLALTGVTGAYPLDIDGDGLLDLAVLRVGENLLLKGGPGCTFAPFDIGFASDAHWTTAFAATWEGASTLPTLAFGNYVNRDDPNGPFRACDVNQLYRPDGDRYAPPLTLAPGFCPLSMLFSDWGGGRADLRVSNDRHYYVSGGEEQMWAMDPTPRLYGPQDGWQSHKLWGMGIASRDLDRDGTDEVMMTSMGDQRLQRRMAGSTGPAFEDVPFALGTTAHRPYAGGDGRPSTGWHVAFGDVTNDGRDDIFIAKGNVEQMPDSAWEDPNNLLVQQPDGTFVEMGGPAGLASLARGRGAVLADLDNDGLLDIAVLNRRAPLELWRNVSPPEGHWLKVRLMAGAPNTQAVGARIEVDDGTGQPPRRREVTVGGGHAGGSALPEHFGLGPAETVLVRVLWPNGGASDWIETAVDREVAIHP